MEQFANLLTFQTGVKFGVVLAETAMRFHEQYRDDDIKLGLHAFQNVLKFGPHFASALKATDLFSKDVQRIMNILMGVKPATEAASALECGRPPRKLHH